MAKEREVRFLVPKRVNRDGRIDYHVERLTLRLPLKRGDREALVRRLGGPLSD